ncbi:SEC-C metal-binding domain-containing protein [Marinoscillum luteum]|uniref:SEC-C metal-binding domain-containing protein n=1 Tax=Marinoscillum luteum TaxID=861051 RepID=A0ABW7N6Z1_9BACT
MKNKKLKALELDVEAVVRTHPELEPLMYKNIPVGLEGIIDIFDLDDVKRGSFQIQVDFSARYPNGFPSLRELSKLIPREIDRHIYDNGNCCVTVLQKQIIESKRGITIERYFKDYVVPFLANQIHFEEYGKWANEEYKHGYAGQVQFYQETTKSTDLSIILKAIKIIIDSTKFSRNEKCFCNSEIKYKKCHEQSISDLRVIGKEQLKSDWDQINEILEEEKI